MKEIKFKAWDKEMKCWAYANTDNGITEFFTSLKTGELDGGSLAIYDDETGKWEYICEEAK